jgi:glycosyltransferase involved in cell wall biosynthesis
MPTFNRLAFLPGALESVFTQQFKEYEVIVVDDGSTDCTNEYLRSLERSITILRQCTKGPGSARNRAVADAKGEYLAFLDSDDLWFPWTLEIYRNVIRESCEPSFIVGKPYIFSAKGELDKVRGGRTQTQKFADYLASGDQWRWWGASSFVIRRDIFLAAGGFSDEFINGEDADLALRLGVAAGFVQITAPATFGYREHTESATNDIDRTLAGALFQIRSEKARRYPGGKARSLERHQILTRHIRPASFSCLRQKRRCAAWRLYLSTFGWHFSLRRMKYLIGFPFIAVAEEFRRRSQ